MSKETISAGHSESESNESTFLPIVKESLENNTGGIFLSKSGTNLDLDDFESQNLTIGFQGLQEGVRINKSELANKVQRTHYSMEIIKCLDWLGENHSSEDPDSMRYFNKLFRLFNEYFRRNPHAEFSGFIQALRDGLKYEMKCIALNKNDFRNLAIMVSTLNDTNKLDSNIVSKYIVKLHNMGLNVVPYAYKEGFS